MLAKQGLARNPAFGQPMPAQKGSEFRGELNMTEAEHTAFTDGPCSKPFHPTLARAAWATCFVDEAGNEVAASYGPVWQSLPQTAACAEATAAAVLAQLLPAKTDPTRAVIDNQSVVGIINHPPPLPALHRLQHAGIWRSAMMEPGWQPLAAGGAEHIRSHQLDDNPGLLAQTDPETARKLKGNQLADTTADEGQTFHPPLDN